MINLRGDLRSPALMYLKAGLFVLAGGASAAGLLAQNPALRTGFLLAITIWSFCRAYYFAFYVIEHYLDPSYKFAGLGDFALYLLRRKRG